MFSDESLNSWAFRIGLSQAGLDLVRQIRSSNPARRVSSRAGNVPGTYPSEKMAFTIQFESHKIELAFVLEYEHDPDVIEFWDQPWTIPLEYSSARGRRIRAMHTPDYFVLRQESAGFEECKPEEALNSLLESAPNRYVLNEQNRWCCPPGAAFASGLGLYYHLRSSAEINRRKFRNMVYLDDYFRKGGAM